ncbi:MAG: helix-turn-helix transcriptional regulator [Sphingomonadaceae bacterium]
MNLSRRQSLAAGVERLTETQRHCLRLTYLHMTSKEIAPLLGLSPHSVDAHIRCAMKVLGVGSRRAAAIALNDIEATLPVRRRPASVQYGVIDDTSDAHVREGPAPGDTYSQNRSKMKELKERPENCYHLDKKVGQSSSISPAFSTILKKRSILVNLFGNLADSDAGNNVILLLLIALLSAMTLATIVSGLAVISLLMTS